MATPSEPPVTEIEEPVREPVEEAVSVSDVKILMAKSAEE